MQKLVSVFYNSVVRVSVRFGCTLQGLAMAVWGVLSFHWVKLWILSYLWYNTALQKGLTAHVCYHCMNRTQAWRPCWWLHSWGGRVGGWQPRHQAATAPGGQGHWALRGERLHPWNTTTIIHAFTNISQTRYYTFHSCSISCRRKFHFSHLYLWRVRKKSLHRPLMAGSGRPEKTKQKKQEHMKQFIRVSRTWIWNSIPPSLLLLHFEILIQPLRTLTFLQNPKHL